MVEYFNPVIQPVIVIVYRMATDCHARSTISSVE